MGYHRKKKPVRVIKPKKFVRINARTIIEVNFDIPDDVAIANHYKKLEDSKPNFLNNKFKKT